MELFREHNYLGHGGLLEKGGALTKVIADGGNKRFFYSLKGEHYFFPTNPKRVHKDHEFCLVFHRGKSISANLRCVVFQIFRESMPPEPSRIPRTTVELQNAFI